MRSRCITFARRRTSLAVSALLALGLAMGAAGQAQAGVDRSSTTIVGNSVYQVDDTFLLDGLNGTWQPTDVAYSSKHDWVWVAESRGEKGKLAAVDPKTLDTVKEVDPFRFSAATRSLRSDQIAVDDEHDLVWVSIGSENAVLAINQTTGSGVTKLGRISTDTTDLVTDRRVAVDPVRDRVYVSDRSLGTITAIDTDSRTVVARWDAEALGLEHLDPVDLAVGAEGDTSHLYILNDTDATLLELTDPAKGDPTTRVLATAVPGGGSGLALAVSPDRRRAYLSVLLSPAELAKPGSAYWVRTFDLDTGDRVGNFATARMEKMDPAWQGVAFYSPAVDEKRGLVYFQSGLLTMTIGDADTGAFVAESRYFDDVVPGPGDETYSFPLGTALSSTGDLFAVSYRDENRLARVRLTDKTAPPPVDPGAAEMRVQGTARLGCRITLRGTNWLNPDATRGSVIAIKLDDGSYARPTGTDIWDTAVASDDGVVDHTLRLPDGTTGANGSKPAYSTGTHWLRLLTGSGLPGDTRRSVTVPITVESGPCGPEDPGAPTDTTISVPPAKQTYGQAAHLKVTVSPKATGKVSVKVRSTTVEGTLTSGKATLTLPAKGLAPGSHKLTVSYPGVEGTFKPSTTTAKVTVTKAVSAVKVTASKTVKRGKNINVTVTVSARGVRPAGKVTVKLAGATAKTVTLNSKGKSVVTIKVGKKTKPGKKKITVTYRGNGYVLGAKAKTVVVRVTK